MYFVNYARVFVTEGSRRVPPLHFAHRSHISEFVSARMSQHAWMYRREFICYVIFFFNDTFPGRFFMLKTPLFYWYTSRHAALEPSRFPMISEDSTLLHVATRNINVHFYIAVTEASVCIQAIISPQRDRDGEPPRTGRRAAAPLHLLTFVQTERRSQTRGCSSRRAPRLRASAVHFNQLLTP